jgi:DNA-binding NarL/FixJ family response regulator
MTKSTHQGGAASKRHGIVVVDDHPIVRQGLAGLVNHEPDLHIIGEASDAAQAMTAVRTLKPELVIIDISLEGTDGLELTKSLKAQYPQLPILIMSMHDEAIYAERALRAGANGYIMKQAVADKIVVAARHILAGHIYLSEQAHQTILQGVAGRKTQAEDSPLSRLSDRELEVLRLIGKGEGTRQIAQALHLSVKTIETYRAHLKDKLGLETATQLVRYAAQWAGK